MKLSDIKDAIISCDKRAGQLLENSEENWHATRRVVLTAMAAVGFAALGCAGILTLQDGHPGDAAVQTAALNE